MLDFERYFGVFKNEHPEKKVEQIDVTFFSENVTGDVYFTDSKAQSGLILTGWEHSTQELLESLDEDNTEYFNAPIRGEQLIYIPNLGDTEGFVNWEIHVDNDLPIPASTAQFADNPYKGTSSMEIATLNRTRNIRINKALSAGDVLKFSARPRSVTLNDQSFDKYTGLYLGSPAGDSIYLVSLPGEQVPWDRWQEGKPVATPNISKRVRVILENMPRWLAEGGKNR